MVFVAPGFVIWMTPPQLHMHFAVMLMAGFPAMRVVGTGGTHGAVTGTHGIGVRTPRAAAVAAATVGLAIEEHMPKVGMLTIGAESVTVAAGLPSTMTVGFRVRSAAGAIPKEHCNMAVAVTAGAGIGARLRRRPAQRSLPSTDPWSSSPVVWAMHTISRSPSSFQLRTVGTR